MSQQRGGSPTKKSPKVEPVKVVVRMRGLNQYEIGKPVKAGKFSRQSIASSRSWKVKDDKSCAQTTNTGESLPRKEGRTHFTYDRVFDEHASTREVFDVSARDIVNSFVHGISGSLIAYGQTGSGKTFTMQGKGSLKDGAEQTEGVIHMTVRTLFEELAKQQSSTFLIRVSAIEVYNEDIRDLLVTSDEHRKVSTRYDSKLGCSVDSTEKFVLNYEEMIGIFSIADKNRIMKKTGMNDRSSRSHTMYKIILEKKDDGDSGNAYEIDSNEDESIQVSTLNLVDLAGSDTVIRNTRIQDEAQKKEGSNINKSLLALSHVIAELGRSKKGFVNFRDSALTKVLQKDLKSQCKIAVICCITPSGLYTEQTRKTLEFGKYAIGVKTRPVRVVVNDNRSVIIKTLKDLNNARSSSRVSEEEKQEVEMKWKEIELATFVGAKINALADAKSIDDEETRSDDARSESTALVDEESPSGQIEDASDVQGTEEHEDCDLSVVHSVAEQKMMEMEDEWNAMKSVMDERSLASGVESGSLVQSQSIPSEIEFIDDDETLDFQLEDFNETDIITDSPDSPDEADRPAFSSLAETKEDPESNPIDYVNENTGWFETHQDDLSALISCGSEESNLIQNGAWAHSRSIVTGLSMGSEISKDADKYPGTVIAGASLDGNTSPGRAESNAQGELNDSMQVFVGSEHDLLTYSEDSTSIYSKNNPNYDDSVSVCSKNRPTYDNACDQQEMNTLEVMKDSVRSIEVARSNSLVCNDTEEQLKANISPFAIQNTTANDQMVKGKDVDTDGVDTKIRNEELEKIINSLEDENQHLRKDIIEITKTLDYESMQAEIFEENEQLMTKKNADLELKVVSLGGKVQSRGDEISSLTSKSAELELKVVSLSVSHGDEISSLISKNADLELKAVSLSDELQSRGDEISSLTSKNAELELKALSLSVSRGDEISLLISKNADLELKAVLLSDELQSRGDEISSLTSKNADQELKVVSLSDELQSRGEELSALTSKVVNFEKLLLEKETQVSELSSRVEELEALLQDLEAPKKVSNQQRAYLEGSHLSISSQDSEETHTEYGPQFSNDEDDEALTSFNSQESEETHVEDKHMFAYDDQVRDLLSVSSQDSVNIQVEDKAQSVVGKDEKALPSSTPQRSEETNGEEYTCPANDEDDSDLLSSKSEESDEPVVEDKAHADDEDERDLLSIKSQESNETHVEDKRQSGNDSEETHTEDRSDLLLSIKSQESEETHVEDKRQSANDSEETHTEDRSDLLLSIKSQESGETHVEDKRQSANDEEEWDPLSINSQESDEASLQDSMEGNAKLCAVSSRCSVDDVDDEHSNFPDTPKARVLKTESGPSLNHDENTMPSFDRGKSEATVNQQPCEPTFSKDEMAETLLSEDVKKATTGLGDIPDRDPQIKNGNGDGNNPEKTFTEISLGAGRDNESDESCESEEENDDENKENSGVLHLHFTRDDLAQTVGESMLSPKKIASMKEEESMLKQWENLSTKFRYHRERVGDK